ncbi:MAG: type II toxin-antitoxin system RelE/ParE family toxin [Beijerinckiaceae bacterium]|nr:type II toxin-antitoxin system RelE/ParE family toxin [Beijerinckiaceae bacterium]
MAWRLSAKAENDIIAIYIESARLFGESQADTYHAGFETAFRFLSDNPRAARERIELSPPVRVHPCGSHVIIYTLEENDDALIVRIRHGREDWQLHPL